MTRLEDYMFDFSKELLQLQNESSEELSDEEIEDLIRSYIQTIIVNLISG